LSHSEKKKIWLASPAENNKNRITRLGLQSKKDGSKENAKQKIVRGKKGSWCVPN